MSDHAHGALPKPVPTQGDETWTPIAEDVARGGGSSFAIGLVQRSGYQARVRVAAYVASKSRWFWTDLPIAVAQHLVPAAANYIEEHGLTRK